ncbi:HNH/ENDO VII family nuclease [Peribacillus phoenicis]|uniref:HNH/ENDO VII family nuclease n=1 Tax=Peribacillus sp. 1P06PA-2 TaxID=3132295 RepID=UPI0039A5D335
MPYNPKNQLSLAGGVPYNVVNGAGLKDQLISMARVEYEISGKGIGNGYNYWNKTTEFKNVKVYQRDDIIDPNMKDARGRTNLERMKKGLAPLGPDGKSINLHHTTQRNESSIAEVTQTFHKENSSIIHINPNTIPSGINRAEFNKWRSEYWKNRTKDFKLENGG